jgi:choline dehydrogenase-like flavoprotein
MTDLQADYVIVGAGSAGCVVADRLSEDGGRVVLLEAGPSDWHPMIHVPAGALHLRANPLVNWNYYAEAEEGTGNRSLHWPRGRVLGGTSSINGMLYVRGNPAITTAGRRWAAAAGPTPTFCPLSRNPNIMCLGTRSIAARAARSSSKITGRSCR